MESTSVESFESIEATANKKSDTKKKLKMRKKVRPLADGDGSLGSNKRKRKQKTSSLLLIRQGLAAIAILALCFLVVHFQSPEKTNFLFKNFIESYKNNYYQIFYGSKHYCSQQLTTNLFERMKHQVLNQDEALKTLEAALNDGNRITSIAFIGTSGVGKTLLARTLQQNFPWPDNVHSYSWNTYVRNEVDRFNLLQLFFDGLSDCGRNLLIIDNLVPNDHEIVNQMQESLRKSVDKYKNVIVIFIFNLNGFEAPDLFASHYNLLQNISKTTIINFKQFDVGDLYECIEHEAELENMTLGVGDFEEILRTIDVKTSGCKKVFAKVLIHGKRN